MQVQYVGTSDAHSISKADWNAVGVSGSDVEWNAENDFTAEVNKEAAEWLFENMPEDFQPAK